MKSTTSAILLRSGRLFARFHLWTLAATTFSLVQPLSRWDSESRARFDYACMMSRKSRQTQRIFAKLLRQELDSSPELNLWLAKIAWTCGRMKLAALIYRCVERSDCSQLLKEVASCQRRFAEGLLDQSIVRQISQSLNTLSRPGSAAGPLILAPVSSNYFELFELWSEHLDCNVSGLRLMLALDAEAVRRLEQRANTKVLDLSAYFVVHDDGAIDRYTRSNLWVLRVFILRELAARGYTVLSLDVDALVIGDLPKLLASLPEPDIVVQEDYSIPMDVARKLGFILCCGFMMIRSNPATRGFLDRYASQTILEMDDQLALNHLLMEDGISDLVRKESHMNFNAAGVSWSCPDKSLVSRDIRYGTVVRHFQQAGRKVQELIEELRGATHPV